MPEYIEREAVYDIFTAKQQELLKFYRYYQLSGEEKEEFNRYDGYLNEIEAIPTADVVEVVRCKDCQHARQTVYGNYHCLVDHRLAHEETDYCSYGERKEGAEE